MSFQKFQQLETTIHSNAESLYALTKLIRDNKEFAAKSESIQVKRNFVEKLLEFERVKKETTEMLEAYFKTEGGVTNLGFRRLHRELTKDLE